MGLDVGVGLEQINLIVEVRQGPVAVGSVAGVVAGTAKKGEGALLGLGVPIGVLLCDLLGVQVVLRDQAARSPADNSGAELADVAADGHSRRDSRGNLNLPGSTCGTFCLAFCGAFLGSCQCWNGRIGRAIQQRVSTGRQVQDRVVLRYIVEFGIGIGVNVVFIFVGRREVCQVHNFWHVLPIVTVVPVTQACQVDDLWCLDDLGYLGWMGHWR